MKKICGIYKITSPTKRIYIGQSLDINKRERQYKNLDCKDQPKLFNSLYKYGWDAHNFEIIHKCTQEELNELERYYIQLFQTFNSTHGLNLQSGGHNGQHSPETIKKISDSHKGIRPSEETRKKLSLALSNRKISDETRKKLGDWQRGDKHRMYGKKMLEKTKDKIRNSIKSK